MLLCSRHGHIQFAVDLVAPFGECLIGEEIHLIRLGYGEAIYNEFALTPLKTFDGVDCDICQSFHLIFCNLISDSGYLVAIRHNHPHRAVRIEIISGNVMNLLHHPCYQFRLLGINLIRYPSLFTADIKESHTAGEQEGVKIILGSFNWRKRGDLMWERHN